MEIGERTLLACGADEYLEVLHPGEVHRSPSGTIFVDLAIESFGATCDRTERTIFRHGETYYRVVLARQGVEIRQIVEVAD